MKKTAGLVGIACVIVGGILLAIGTAQPVAIALLILGLIGLAFTVGGSAGTGA